MFKHNDHDDEREAKMLSGELIVVGTDRVHINLHKHHHPERVSVKFKGHHEPHPCNPHHHDELEWHIVLGEDDVYHLTIFWSVSATREIKWEVFW